jgi:peptidoglycan/LPS O-acetylase OafA/YrhL
VAGVTEHAAGATTTPGFGRPAEHLGYQPALEGLRGLAVLLVLAVHLGEFVVPSTNVWFVPGGFIGVDIFFVLSGFLIGAILIGELDRIRSVRLGYFYVRRFVRIVPALVLFLAVHFLYVAWSTHTSLGTERSVDISAVLFVSNWRNSVGLGRFGDMVHLWSVALEVQWYIVAPLIVFVLHRYVRRTSRIVAVLVAAAVFLALLRYVEYKAWNDWNLVYQRTDARFDTFLLGLLVAFLWRRGVLRVSVQMVGALGLLAIAAVCFTAQAHKAQASPFLFEWGSTLVAVAGAGVIAACLLTGSVIERAFHFVGLRATGRISYSLYLWHLPVYIWVATHLHQNGAVKMFVAVVLSFACATAAYFVAEWPVLRRRPHVIERSDQEQISMRAPG